MLLTGGVLLLDFKVQFLPLLALEASGVLLDQNLVELFSVSLIEATQSDHLGHLFVTLVDSVDELLADLEDAVEESLLEVFPVLEHGGETREEDALAVLVGLAAFGALLAAAVERTVLAVFGRADLFDEEALHALDLGQFDVVPLEEAVEVVLTVDLDENRLGHRGV